MLIMKSQQRLKLQRYKKERGEITIHTVGLLKDQEKWDPQVILTDLLLTGKKLVSLNLEDWGQKNDRDFYEYLGQGDQQDGKVICTG